MAIMNITRPLVSFVVPCYNLAHYLKECVDSILAQSFTDFEVLIMDDCSPDDTPRVATAFTDRRVRYIRNETNLGHMQNYNVGIQRARGKYLWVISADDRLRSREILKRFADILESDESITFAFCPGLILTADGREGAATGRVYPGDRMLSSDEFVKRAVQNNPVCTPGALARRSCYTDMGLFAVDLPFAGDWLAWCVFGLHGNVAYLEEPMVNYRLHGGSNTAVYRRDRVELITHDEVEVRWRVHRLARHAHRWDLAAACREAMARDYSRRLFKGRTQSILGMSLDEFERSVASYADRIADAAAIRSRVF
jgi:glycosyltransferase involved in cell wall biosynthesis